METQSLALTLTFQWKEKKTKKQWIRHEALEQITDLEIERKKERTQKKEKRKQGLYKQVDRPDGWMVQGGHRDAVGS